jgi:putative DNA primase/helicase
MLPTWLPYQKRRPTERELSEWQRLNPPTWAVITGAISGRIALDFDGEPGRQTIRELGLQPHRSTPSGGYHVDFVHPGWYVPTLNAKTKRELGERWPGLDIRADGGYVVFTGHTNHGVYRWLRGPTPHSLDILPYDLREFLGLLRTPGAIPIQPQTNGKVCSMPSNGRVDAERLIAMALEKASSGGRNNAGFWLAAQLRDNGYTITEAETVVRNYRSRCPGINTKGKHESYSDQEIQASLREAYSRPSRDPWGHSGHRHPPRPENMPKPVGGYSVTPPGSNSEPDLLLQPYTDTGNAERLLALYGRDIRFSKEMKKWLVWDGKRWNSEDPGCIKRLATRTIRKMYTQALAINDKDARRNAERHARDSESAKSITAMLTCAEYQEGIRVVADELDRNPYLLNFRNGTLDLKDGTLHKPRREDLITKLVHFDFDRQAKCPLFLEFLHRIMGAGPDASEADLERASRLVSYLQKCFGYSLTGDVSEKVVFCLFGAGNNGKTTLLEAIRFVLAEYSTQVLIDSLMRYHSRESNASLADLADLRGARFVTTSEAEEGQRLAVGKLKYLTQGMGKIKTCRKYENPIEFTATHKLFLDANHKPVIRGGEKAIWNRLKPIPFTVTIPDEEIDKGMLEKLKAEAVGILAWLVEGCRRWKSEGLGDTPEVAEASAAWQAESDRFAEFLEEECELEADAWIPVSDLWALYKSWCGMNHERAMPKTSFDERLESLGCKKGSREHGTVRAWVGIGLKSQSLIPRRVTR